ncbi:MAG: hypothetical protein PHY43_02290 [Verrucomicrobiales bacterium]|nr:hypothetical protein [Verrucomicrobiales bacterium]
MTLSWEGVRKLPYAFTEHGALMLANVLNSERAAQTSVRSSAFLCGCGRCWLPMPGWPASWPRWSRNTTRSSRLCSTPSGS